MRSSPVSCARPSPSWPSACSPSPAVSSARSPRPKRTWSWPDAAEVTTQPRPGPSRRGLPIPQVKAAADGQWLAAKPKWWRRRVKVLTMDPSARFRAAVRYWLPKARVAVDHFYAEVLVMPMLLRCA